MTGICVCAALVMIAVSTSMNFLFMKSLATHEAEGLVLGAASASADILKAALPWFIALAWRSRRYLFAVVGSVVFVGFSLFSLLSALGFAADVRGGLVDQRSAASRDWRAKEETAAGLTARRKGLGVVRGADVIAADMAIARQDGRWTSTNGCTDATLPASRTFCKEYLGLEAERVASLEAARIDGQLKVLADEMAALRAQGAGAESDPQVAVIARLLTQDRDIVRTMLIVAAALLVEVGSGLGLWLALGHSEPRRGPSGFLGRRSSGGELEAPVSESCEAARERPAMKALPPSAEKGDVTDFCVERLHPARDGEVTMLGIYRSYQVWCRDRDLVPLAPDDFAREFDWLAAEWGLTQDDDRYVGIRVGLGLGWQ